MENALVLAAGWGTGYAYAKAKTKENEVKQGKNYYQASMCQSLQAINLSNVINTLSENFPNNTLRICIKVSSTVSSLFGFVFFPTCAAVKQGHYESGVLILNEMTREKYPLLSNCLPQKLNTKTIKFLSFLSEHSGDLTTGAMVVGTAAITLFGNVYFASSMLAPVIYQTVDSAGFIPRKISLFMERYMATFSNVGMLIGGGAFMKVMSAGQLITYIPQANSFIQRKIVDIFKYLFSLKKASIQEIEAPLVTDKFLSYIQILNIIHCEDGTRFTTNLAHSSRSTRNINQLPACKVFDKYLEFFELFNWENNYVSLKNAIKDDDRFLDKLRTEFPNENDYILNFDSYLFRLAVKELGENVAEPEKKYIIDLIKLQMKQLVKVLKGENRAAGSQLDTSEAIDNCAAILAYLNTLEFDKKLQKIEMQDILQKLAIEGGEYCARGVKRASREILNGIIPTLAGSSTDPLEIYELQLRQRFELERIKIMTAKYQEISAFMIDLAKNGNQPRFSRNQVTDKEAVAITQDVHTFDIYRLVISLGLVPLTDNERNSIGINELLMWGNPGFCELRKEMYLLYECSLSSCINELGKLQFFNYIRNIIENNPSLSTIQKNYILDKLTGSDDEAWSPEIIEIRFHRLALVMLGVLNYESMYDEWVNIEKAVEPQPVIKIDRENFSQEIIEDYNPLLVLPVAKFSSSFVVIDEYTV